MRCYTSNNPGIAVVFSEFGLHSSEECALSVLSICLDELIEIY